MTKNGCPENQEEYEKWHADQLKDRRQRFVAHAGEFIITPPQKEDSQPQQEKK